MPFRIRQVFKNFNVFALRQKWKMNHLNEGIFFFHRRYSQRYLGPTFILYLYIYLYLRLNTKCQIVVHVRFGAEWRWMTWSSHLFRLSTRFPFVVPTSSDELIFHPLAIFIRWPSLFIPRGPSFQNFWYWVRGIFGVGLCIYGDVCFVDLNFRRYVWFDEFGEIFEINIYGVFESGLGIKFKAIFASLLLILRNIVQLRRADSHL